MHVFTRLLSPAFRSLVVLFCTFALVYQTADATTFPRLTTKDLVTKSDAIAIGKCVGTSSKWVDGRIETEIVLSVSRYLKGDLGASVTVTRLGGNVDNIGMLVPGAPKFRIDEEVLVYISQKESGRNSVMGWALGKFSIRADGTGEKMIFSNPENIQIMKEVDGKAVESPARAQSFKLESYIQEVNTILGKEGGIDFEKASTDEAYETHGKRKLER